jgi:hypothetical protein
MILGILRGVAAKHQSLARRGNAVPRRQIANRAAPSAAGRRDTIF